MVHILGWRIVATVAAQPANQVENAGKPLELMVAGRAAPVMSVVRIVLNGLYAALLLVEPPSAACHWSRSATFTAVTGACRPCRMHSSHPAGSAVPPEAGTANAGPPEGTQTSAQSPTAMAASTSRRRKTR